MLYLNWSEGGDFFVDSNKAISTVKGTNRFLLATGTSPFLFDMRKTFLYRAKINKKTECNCLRWFELCRTLYNLALEQRIWAYKERRIALSYYDQSKQLPELKDAFPEFKDINATTFRETLQRLDKAYQAFFRRVKERNGKAGFPRFKGKESYNSFTLLNNGWKLTDKYLHVTNLGRFKLYLSRPIEGEIKTITISRSASGKFFVAFSCNNVPDKSLVKTSKQIAIDVGLEHFFTDQNGNTVENPRYFKHSKDLLAGHHQKLSRRKFGSNRRRKMRILLAKTHEKVTRQRRDFHFKTANNLVKENDVIYIEKFPAFTSYTTLNRSMNDAAWFGFFDILRFKATEAGKEVVEVPARYTSRTCSQCGYVLEELPLKCRQFMCPVCSFTLGRDQNAACNIYRLGQSLRMNPRTLANKDVNIYKRKEVKP